MTARRKLAALILYSVLLLASGYIAGRSTATTAAPGEIQGAAGWPPPTATAGSGLTSTTEVTDWLDLTPDEQAGH